MNKRRWWYKNMYCHELLKDKEYLKLFLVDTVVHQWHLSENLRLRPEGNRRFKTGIFFVRIYLSLNELWTRLYSIMISMNSCATARCCTSRIRISAKHHVLCILKFHGMRPEIYPLRWQLLAWVQSCSSELSVFFSCVRTWLDSLYKSTLLDFSSIINGWMKLWCDA